MHAKVALRNGKTIKAKEVVAAIAVPTEVFWSGSVENVIHHRHGQRGRRNDAYAAARFEDTLARLIFHIEAHGVVALLDEPDVAFTVRIGRDAGELLGEMELTHQ